MKPRRHPVLTLLFAASLSACSTTDQQVDELIERLAANEIDSPAWQQAVDELSEIGRPAARQLIAHLNPDLYIGEMFREYRAEQEQIRTGSARALGRIKPRGASAALKDRIVVGYTDAERIACIWAVGEIGFDQAALDALKVQLLATDPAIRLHAAVAIVKMDEEDGAPQIRAAVSGADEGLAAIVLAGLAECNYFGVPLLAELASTPGPHQNALLEVQSRIREILVRQLRAEEPVQRQRSARALGRIGDATAREPLLRLLDDSSNLVRFNAAAALATMSDSRGIEFLFAALKNQDPILRTNAVTFLTQVQRGSGSVQQQLIAALQAADPLSRAGAAQVLGQAGVAPAVEALVTATGDQVPEVRCAAAVALGRIRATAGRPRLEALLQDENETVAYYAEWALAQLGQG
jgi:HEAT repeat protein